MNIIRFKLFKIKLVGSKPYFEPDVDLEAANLMRKQEEELLKKLRKGSKKFRFIKLVPDELPSYFWGLNANKETKKYIENLKKTYARYAPETEVITVSELLKDARLKNLYNTVYKKVYSSFDKNYDSKLVNKKMFDLETQKRSTYYTETPLPKEESQELARKAFALFASEAALIYELERLKVLPELYLLSRKDKVDSYKYEFFKFPKTRPPFRKIFVI